MKIVKLLSILTLLLIAFSCSSNEDIEKIEPKLKIETYYKGDPLKDVYLSVYKSLEDLKNVENKVFEGTTNASGIIQFEGAEADQEYYIDATKIGECINNYFALTVGNTINTYIKISNTNDIDLNTLRIDVRKTAQIKLKNNTGTAVTLSYLGSYLDLIQPEEEFFFEFFPIEDKVLIKFKDLDTEYNLDHIEVGNCINSTLYNIE
ncbi:hypothetical protein [Tenacibaculum sp. MAR_2009_124]|uniref:hypothetical protein n=1 Tax=Tenacibaculum sp. MAR_2009_124 TaxID=1250059 RepID=UPI000B863752|nr:hypothetical protein [Tenacibaculum sp. MAR_2009_124]